MTPAVAEIDGGEITSYSGNYDFYERERTGRLVARMTSDIDAMSDLVTDGLVTLTDLMRHPRLADLVRAYAASPAINDADSPARTIAM